MRAKEVEKVSFPQYNSKKEEGPSQDGDYTILTRPLSFIHQFKNPNLSRLFNAQHFTFFQLGALGRFTSQSQHHCLNSRRLRLLFQGNIRPRSRPSERPGELRCVLTPSALHRAWVPQFFSAVKGAPERRIPCGKPHDSTSAQRHGATNRPKGHSGPSACKIPWA